MSARWQIRRLQGVVMVETAKMLPSPICRVQDGNEANARLIAAAPELLSALIKAEAILNQIHPAAIEADESYALDAARAAIDKATGS